MTRPRPLALMLALLLLGAVRPAYAQDPADLAWDRGDYAIARDYYATRLAKDSTDVRALHRLALLDAWDGEYDRGLALLDRLLALSPGNTEARIDRARVLAWAGRATESLGAYAEVLARAPENRAARLGLAQALAWSGRLDSAQAIYARMIAADPNDLEAWQGSARTAAWQGDLHASEVRWRNALTLDKGNTVTRVGLAQVLRWQGQPEAASRVLEGIAPAERTAPEVAEELRWVRAATAPGITPAAVFETDSDGNDILSLVLRGSGPVRPRLRIGFEGYFRTASWDPQQVPTRQAFGAMATGTYLVAPAGWSVGAGVGLSTSNGTDASTAPSLRASVSSPAPEPVRASLAVQHAALDATALIIERGVTFTEVSAGVRGQLAASWLLEGGASYTWLEGSEPNRRLGGHVTGTWTIAPPWAAAARVRSFGFSKDLQDGYFDPNFYLQAETYGRWMPLRGPWHVVAEVGPGLEQVTTDGSLHATIRVAASAAYDVAPGRQIGLAALYSNAGVQSFATGAAGYRYFSLTLSGSWAF